MELVARVALRWRFAFSPADMAPEELGEMARFLTTQVDGMDDRSICFGAYATNSLPNTVQPLVKPLRDKLVLAYRKRLVGWFEYALKKRANLGGGGATMRKIELGLVEFVKAIPDAIMTGKPIRLAQFIPVSRYLDVSKLDPVAAKIVSVVRNEAMLAGVLPAPGKTARSMPFSVKFDNAINAWFIPEMSTYNYREQLKQDYGFWWRPERKRWEIKQLTPAVRRDFKVIEPPAEKLRVPAEALPKAAPSTTLEQLRSWFLHQWYPKNAGRFTKVFTEFARNKQSSYTFTFGHRGTEPLVIMERTLETPAQIVEELRYRYVGRQGREPWLEVLEKFVQLVDTTDPTRLVLLIDRINNLQHSNGLFMEHFPGDVKAWYEQFLNAKYHAPTAADLAQYIPDRDLRKLLVELARPMTAGPRSYTPPPAYHLMVKKLEEENKVNWRELGYPMYPGVKQVDRFAPEVQNGLDTLRRLETERDQLLSTRVQSETDYERWQDRVTQHVERQDALVQKIEDAVDAGVEKMEQSPNHEQQLHEDPSYAATWTFLHDTKNFLKDFPGAMKSDLAWFHARYGAKRVAERWLQKHEGVR